MAVGQARKEVLPQTTLTQVCSENDKGATLVKLQVPGEASVEYYVAPRVDADTGERRDGKPRWVAGTYRLFPLVLCGDDSPWAEANLWILDMLEMKVLPNMLTFAGIAEDLSAFRRYIEAETLDWLCFPAHKLRRPTYRYNAALRISVEAGEVSPGVAKRRMATVVRFYRWLMGEAGFRPEQTPWNESDRYVDWTDGTGFERVIKVTTTDVSLKDSKAEDPWDDRIMDGGRLRPLPENEQRVLLQALGDIGNTEMSLIHLISLFSGARIQTVLTLRLRHVSRPPAEIPGNDFRLKAGPGTGIDTKGNKRGVLHIPKWLYERLYIYAKSERAQARRRLAKGGDHVDQFLFLSHRGTPHYESKASRDRASSDNAFARHAKVGQGVRQFIKEKLLPEMQARLGNPRYEFSFHDLRATYGMNTVDYLLERMETGKMTYSRALSRLRHLMWHTRLSTTENYLNYRENLFMIDAVQDGWHDHLQHLAEDALSHGAGHESV